MGALDSRFESFRFQQGIVIVYCREHCLRSSRLFIAVPLGSEIQLELYTLRIAQKYGHASQI